MKINRDNYEAYFLDYHEGRLSPEMSQEVIDFVHINPDLQDLFFGFEGVTLLSEQNIVFEKKSELKKNQVIGTAFVNENNYEEFLIAETEGLLSKAQISMLDEFIRINPQLQTERSLYAKTHLAADSSIVFENKESLKQTMISVGAINSETCETFMARELEGDLSQPEELELAEFYRYNPHLIKDRERYRLTILKPDTSIVFEAKRKLKYSVVPVRKIVYYALSAAASLAIIMSVYIQLDRNNLPESLADKNRVKHTIDQTEPAAPKVTGNLIASENNQTSSQSKQNQVSNINTVTLLAENSVPVSQNQTNEAIRQHQPVSPVEARQAGIVSSLRYVDPQFTFIRVSQMYSNHHLELYYNLKLAEEMQYAQMNTKDANPSKTILNQVKQMGGNLFASKNQDIPKTENRNFSMWTLAELGVQTLNTVTSSQMELKLKKDDEGKVVGYGLESGLIEIDKDFKK